MPVLHQAGQHEPLALLVSCRVAEIVIATQKVSDHTVLLQNAQAGAANLLCAIGKTRQKILRVHANRPGLFPPPCLPPMAASRAQTLAPFQLPGNRLVSRSGSGNLKLRLARWVGGVGISREIMVEGNVFLKNHDDVFNLVKSSFSGAGARNWSGTKRSR